MAQQPYPLEPFQCPAGQFTYAFNPVTGGLPGWFCATPGVAKQIVTPPVTTVGDLAVWGNTNGTSLIDNGTTFPTITVANNNGLKALPIPVAGTVAYRVGFNAVGDGGGALYTFFSSNCSISGGDNGYEVQPNVGAGCWIAQFSGLPASGAVWGQVCDGVTNGGPAVQAALSAAGLGATTTIVMPPGRCLISSNVAIPSGITLSCGNPQNFNAVVLGALNTAPAIVLNPANTISESANGAGVSSCLIVASGITFPVTSEPTWTGIALSDGGFGDFTVTNSEIVGFDTAIKITGKRPYINRVAADGSGVTNAVLELDVGNTDSGYLLNSRVTNLAENSATPLRPGTGVRNGLGGSLGVTMDMVNVLSIFMTNNFDFENGAIVTDIDSDGVPSAHGNIGINVGVNVALSGSNIRSNQMAVDLQNAGQIHVSTIDMSFGTNCITNSGQIYANVITTGQCSNSAYEATNVNAITVTNTLIANTTHSGAAPYFISSVGTVYAGSPMDAPNGGFWFGALNADISGNLFSSDYTAVGGSAPMFTMMKAQPTITGTGAGSGATYSLIGTPVSTGTLQIIAGSGASAVGTMVLTFPFRIGTIPCQFTPQTNWTAAAAPTTSSTSTTVTVNWGQAAALTNGQTYGIVYHCDFQ